MKNQKAYKPKMANISQMWLNILIPFVDEYVAKLTAGTLSKKTKIPTRTVSRMLNNIANKNIIRYVIEGKNKKYYLDLNNPKTKILIRLIEDYKTFKLSLTNLELFVILEEILNFRGFVLFGSYSKGNFAKESDIDVLIIGKKSNKINEISKKFNKEINAHFSTIEEFEELLKKKNTLALEIIKNHTIFECPEFVDLCWGFYKNEI